MYCQVDGTSVHSTLRKMAHTWYGVVKYQNYGNLWYFVSSYLFLDSCKKVSQILCNIILSVFCLLGLEEGFCFTLGASLSMCMFNELNQDPHKIIAKLNFYFCSF